MRGRRAWCAALVVLAALAAAVACASEQKRSVLVVVDTLSQRHGFSALEHRLSDEGFEVKFVEVHAKDAKLKQNGEFVHDAIIMLATSSSLFGGVELDDMEEFVRSGRSVVVGLTPKPPKVIKELADLFGTRVVGGMVSTATPTCEQPDVDGVCVRATKALDGADVIVGKGTVGTRGIVARQAVGLAVSSQSELSLPVVPAPASSVALSVDDEKVPPVQPALALVTAFQTRANARVVFLSSSLMLSNADWATNGAALGNVVSWALLRRGVLRSSPLEHTTAAGEHVKSYRVTDDMRVSFVVEELGQGGQWSPFVADDIQLELMRLDPLVRQPMKHEGKGLYVLQTQVPDVYGHYHLRVNYAKLGYTFLHAEVAVPVRPFRHNEYERFIPCATPYYAGAVAVMTGFAVVVSVVLFMK